jgi:pyruvate/2-oxoacid:ferredoxin oxidoreductase beta subunit
MTIEVQRMAVETNYFPLWEFEKDKKKIRFTHATEHPFPIERYLSMVGKFRHLNDGEVAHIQKSTDDRMELLKSLS